MDAVERDEREITASPFRSWLRERTGAASEVTLSDVRHHTEGFSWQTYTFTATWRDDAGQHSQGFAVRREPEDGLLAPYDIEGQFSLHRTLAETTSVPVPTLRWLETDRRVLGMPFYVMDRVDGRVPTQFTADDPDVFPSPAARRAIGRDFVAQLATIHSTRHDDIEVPRASSPQVASAESVERWLRDYRDARLTRIPYVELAAAWALDNPAGTGTLVLCHGDYRIGNVMIGPGTTRISAILDWELAEVSDPASDIAWAALPLFRGRSPLWSHLLDGAEFLAEYERATGLSVSAAAVQHWTVVNLIKVVSSYLRAARAYRDGRSTDLRLAAMGHQLVYVIRLLRDELGKAGAL